MSDVKRALLCERILQHTMPEPNSGCWIWLSAIDGWGYGRISVNGTARRASRAAWMAFRGDPGDLHVLHRCDNPLCTNPDHLFLGTNQDNCIDKARKGRHPVAKLNPEKVRAIRQLHGAQSLHEIGRQFGVSHSIIHRILKGVIWNHVQ